MVVALQLTCFETHKKSPNHFDFNFIICGGKMSDNCEGSVLKTVIVIG